MTTAKASHSGSIGDTLAAIPAMREYYRQTGKKIVLHLIKGVPAFYYEGATHPTRDEKTKEMVMLNSQAIEMVKPLFLAQDFIEDVVEVTEDVPDSLRLHAIRESFVGMPSFSINRWYFYIYPDLTCDLSKVWMQVPDSEKDFAKGKIVITRTERYQNNADYSFLKPYEDDLVFSGTQREWNQFCMAFDLNVKKLHIKDFLELAQAIKQSKFHISNQTMAWQISDGLKHPRILELCSFAPNCIPIGENAYDFFGQLGLEYAFHKLNGTLNEYLEIKKAAQKEQLSV